MAVRVPGTGFSAPYIECNIRHDDSANYRNGG